MKKSILFTTSFLYLTLVINAQTMDNKRDNIWIFGYDSAGKIIDTCYGNTKLSFDKKPLKSKFQYTDMNLSSDVAMISDTSGKLLFYTNGIYIADSTHQPMKNGQGLNPGEFADIHKDYGYISEQGAIILPKPGSNYLYYLIHTPLVYDTKKPVNYQIYADKLYYSLIDMGKNNGKGEVVEKNKILYDKNELGVGKITACRHANGIDWWIVVADFVNTKYNVFLLSEKGIEFISKQAVPKGQISGVGQTTFTPDGTKYIYFNGVSISQGTFLDIFDFDRCKGLLTNQRSINFKKDSAYAVGTAISPNSKYLYVFNYQKVYQFDLQAADIFKSIDTVGIFDGIIPKEFDIPNYFYLAQLAPDGKIYVSVPGTSKYLHVVNEPNKKGKACNFVQRGFTLAGNNYTTMPNFPNFRLGKAAQPCEMVGNEEVEKVKYEVKLYPNPSDGNLIFDNGVAINTTLYIYDISGKVILSQNISDKITPINISHLSNGIYYCRLWGDDNTYKFTIIH